MSRRKANAKEGRIIGDILEEVLVFDAEDRVTGYKSGWDDTTVAQRANDSVEEDRPLLDGGHVRRLREGLWEKHEDFSQRNQSGVPARLTKAEREIGILLSRIQTLEQYVNTTIAARAAVPVASNYKAAPPKKQSEAQAMMITDILTKAT